MALMGFNWPQHTINYLGYTIAVELYKGKTELFRLNLDSY